MAEKPGTVHSGAVEHDTYFSREAVSFFNLTWLKASMLGVQPYFGCCPKCGVIMASSVIKTICPNCGTITDAVAVPTAQGIKAIVKESGYHE